MKRLAFTYEGDLETHTFSGVFGIYTDCLLYTSDAADDIGQV